MQAVTSAFCLVVSLTALTALAGPARAGADRGDARRVPERPLRVATFNIHHGAGLDGNVDLERIAAVVESTGAEVVGLQEVDRHWSERSDFVDQATWLADQLGMQLVYGANLDLDPPVAGAARRQYGTAILSRYKILSWSNTLLPRPQGGEQRGLLQAEIRVRGAQVTVFDTHLQNTSQVERLAQVGVIRSVLAATPGSLVLLGDLNATPQTPEIGAITEDLVDAWAVAGEGDGFTYDALVPHARIDYVLTSSSVVARAAAVVSSDASDHLPVVVELALPLSKVHRDGRGHAPTASDVLVEQP